MQQEHGPGAGGQQEPFLADGRAEEESCENGASGFRLDSPFDVPLPVELLQTLFDFVGMLRIISEAIFGLGLDSLIDDGSGNVSGFS